MLDIRRQAEEEDRSWTMNELKVNEDNKRLKQLCETLEQMNDILSDVVDRCQCGTRLASDDKKWNQLKLLRDKYDLLKELDEVFRYINDIEVQEVVNQSVEDKLSAEELPAKDGKRPHRLRSFSEPVRTQIEGLRSYGLRPKADKQMIRRELRFKCQSKNCLKIYCSKAGLDHHMRSHTDIGRFVCAHLNCGQAFFRKRQLSKHTSDSHPGYDTIDPVIELSRSPWNNKDD